MAVTFEKLLVYHLIPITIVIALLLVLPLPRMIKKVAFWVTELTIPQFSTIKLGYLYCFLCLAVSVSNLMGYINYTKKLSEETESTMQLERDCTDPRYCNVTVNLANRQFRNTLISAFGFMLSIMNFVLTNKQRNIYNLQDEIAESKKNK